jgi:hypothetical protein
MKTRHRLFALAASLVLVCTFAAAAQVKGTGLYKWTDKDGVTHYGDTIPPEYAAQEREELNRQGVTVRELPRQLSAAEAAAAKKKAAEEDRRKQHDSFLLHSYTSVSDIEQLRDERIVLIESQMELARTAIATTNQRLAAQEARLKNFRPYAASTNARRVPDQLAAEVVRSLSERRSLQTQLEKYAADKVEQQRSFGADIARYKELTAANQAR